MGSGERLAPLGLPVGVEVKDKTVNVSELDPGLLAALTVLGWLHLRLFDKLLVITSGNDGQHVKGSMHAQNKAVDLRATDKTDEEQLVWSVVQTFLQKRWRYAVFDERTKPGGSHWHVECSV